MTSIPTILVVGARDVTLQLSGSFPPPYCRVLNAANIAEALNYAAHASVVVVDSAVPGGPMELIRRLRADHVTVQIPLVLRFHPQQPITQALTDASVPANDYEGLVRAIRHLAPDISTGLSLAPESLDDQGEAYVGDYSDDYGGDYGGDYGDDALFDDGESTVVWRRPEAEPGAASEWPPPAPEYIEGQGHVEFALSFAGYMNSLIEALEDPSRLSEAEYQRLCHVSHRTPDASEKCLDQIQTAINTALMSKDLEGMKVLSTAKNSLYEKLQRLRTLLQDVPDVPDPAQAAARAPGTAPPPGAAHPPAARTGAEEEPWAESDTMQEAIRDAMAEVEGQSDAVEAHQGARQGARQASAKSTAKKSALTLAAEKKERAKREQEAARRAKAAKEQRLKKQYSVKGTARKGRGVGPMWLWIVIAAVVVLGSGGWIALNFITTEETKSKITQQNTPPRMVNVALEQTAAGIVVRPQAQDDENDRISFSIRWFLNGSPVPGGNSARLAVNKYSTGDRVVAEVRPRDQYGIGSAMVSQALQVRDLKRPPPKPAQ